MTDTLPGLSKSRFVAGWQCHKQLWLKVHEPDAPELEVDVVLEDRFDQGRQVGELACTRFPGGVLVEGPPRDPARAAITRALIAEGAPAIFEATFIEHGVYVAVDILERTAEGFTLIEVKSSTKAKPEHIPDAAVQAWVARAAGVPVTRVEIMHLDTNFRHPDRGELFARTDVTPDVEAMQADVPALVAGQRAVLAGPQPDIPIGLHCWALDRGCPFWERCCPRTPGDIWSMYWLGPDKKWALYRQGFHRLLDLPAGHRLNKVQQRQRRALETGRTIVEPGLAAALEPFSGRLGFLDFETVNRAVPVWDDVGPWRPVVVQFSYHERQADGTWTHRGYLAEGPHDPREELAERLIAATRDAERIVMYSHFERSRIRELRDWVPRYAAELTALEGKMVDLLPVMREYVYHPDFEGSFSIKSVLTPLVPDLSYSDLAIVDGLTASVEIARLLFVAHKVKDRDRTRRDLLAYCEQDTWAMVRLLDALRALAA